MTKILRSELLARLTRISPALSSSDVIPVATHFCFTGDDVFAYNDQIAMSMALSTDFTGAVPGKVLLSLLNNSSAEKVEMVQEGNNLVIKAASSKWDLAVMPPDQFIFEMPSPASGKAFPLMLGNFTDGLKSCLRSVTKDPEQNGVTLVGHDKGVTLYALDDNTISRARLVFEGNIFKRRVLLPEAFCRQFINIHENESRFEIRVDKDNDKRGYALATGSGVTLFGRLLDPSTQIEFATMIKQYVPDDYKGKLVAMPDKLASILDQAMVIMDNSDEHAATTITVNQGKASFHTQSKRGIVNDHMNIDKAHDDVRIKIDPRYLKVGYDSSAKWMLTSQAVIIAKNNSLYLIGRVSPNK